MEFWLVESTLRTCIDCGKQYLLPIPYEKANPLIRDRCVDCISIYQRNHERTEKEEWFI